MDEWAGKETTWAEGDGDGAADHLVSLSLRASARPHHYIWLNGPGMKGGEIGFLGIKDSGRNPLSLKGRNSYSGESEPE